MILNLRCVLPAASSATLILYSLTDAVRVSELVTVKKLCRYLSLINPNYK